MRIFWLFLMIPLFSSGQYAIVRGVAPLAIGEEIQLRVNDDPISGKERVLATQKIDVDGSFEIKVMPNGVQYAFLQVGQNCADFFIDRGKDVELSFVPPAQDPLKPRAFNERQFFIPKITGGSGMKLNEQIIAFNDTLDGFLESIYPILKMRKSPGFVAKQVAVFEEMVSKRYADAEPFVKDYVRFSVADIEQTFLTDRDRLFNKYLNGVEPLFNNPAYVDFALQFFQDELYKMAVVNRYDQCKKALAGNEAFAKIDAMLLELEPKLSDVSLRRMVLIQGLDGLFGERDFQDDNLVRALRYFGMQSSNSYLTNAAKNIADKHSSLTKGTPSPDIEFMDVSGSEKKLSDLFGEYIFLELTDATNVYSNRETNVIPNLKSDFKLFRFVTICVGNSEREMMSLKKKMNIDWELGRVSITSEAIENYQIKSLPLFFIIDPEGNFYAAPAKDPTKGAQQELMRLNEKLKADRKWKIGR